MFRSQRSATSTRIASGPLRARRGSLCAVRCSASFEYAVVPDSSRAACLSTHAPYALLQRATPSASAWPMRPPSRSTTAAGRLPAYDCRQTALVWDRLRSAIPGHRAADHALATGAAMARGSRRGSLHSSSARRTAPRSGRAALKLRLRPRAPPRPTPCRVPARVPQGAVQHGCTPPTAPTGPHHDGLPDGLCLPKPSLDDLRAALSSGPASHDRASGLLRTGRKIMPSALAVAELASGAVPLLDPQAPCRVLKRAASVASNLRIGRARRLARRRLENRTSAFLRVDLLRLRAVASGARAR